MINQITMNVQIIIQKLRQRDQEVRQHEMAHIAAGGEYIRGGPFYKYQKGPDGKMYAVGGEVEIDTSPERNPQKTIEKMEKVKKAALAPRNPSAQDRMVAMKASIEEMKARLELNKNSRYLNIIV